MARAKQNELPVDEQNFLDQKKYTDVTTVWTLDPHTFLEILFHMFKQENHFIARKYDRRAAIELVEEVSFKGDPTKEMRAAVDLIYRDYDNSTEMKSLKYSKGGLIQFKRYYEAVLLEEGMDLDTIEVSFK